MAKRNLEVAVEVHGRTLDVWCERAVGAKIGTVEGVALVETEYQYLTKYYVIVDGRYTVADVVKEIKALA